MMHARMLSRCYCTQQRRSRLAATPFTHTVLMHACARSTPAEWLQHTLPDGRGVGHARMRLRQDATPSRCGSHGRDPRQRQCRRRRAHFSGERWMASTPLERNRSAPLSNSSSLSHAFRRRPSHSPATLQNSGQTAGGESQTWPGGLLPPWSSPAKLKIKEPVARGFF